MQRTEDFRKGMDTMEWKGFESMDWTEGLSDCRAWRVEKSKLEAERSRDVAENKGKAEDLTGTGPKGQDRARVSSTTLSQPRTWTILLVNSEM